MKNIFVIFNLFCLIFIVGCNRSTNDHVAHINQTKTKDDRMLVYIIIASVRSTQTGAKIATNIKAMIDKRSDINAEIVDIKHYNLPFYTDPVAPADREGEIADKSLKAWSDKIKQADAYIIISPEYNAGYPGPLKNALDSLYKEWSNKPVGIIGYSGGSSGGSSMIAQLRQVAKLLQMTPVKTDIKIAQSWKALNPDGTLANANLVDKDLNMMLDELIQEHNALKNKSGLIT